MQARLKNFVAFVLTAHYRRFATFVVAIPNVPDAIKRGRLGGCEARK